MPEINHDGYQIIRDAQTLASWVDRIRDLGVVAVDTETTGLDAMRAGLVGVCLALGPGEAAYVPLAPELPADRSQRMLNDGEVRLLVADESLDSALLPPEAQVVELWSEDDATEVHRVGSRDEDILLAEFLFKTIRR